MRPSFALPNTQKPKAGPVGIPVTLNFTGTDFSNGELGAEQMGGVIDYVQSIYIDNSANTKSLNIIFSGLGYSLTVKAGRQGIFPVICGAGVLSWRATSVGSGIAVAAIMMSEQLPYFQWDAV